MATDTLVLSGMRFYGYHGDDPRERGLGQPYEVDIELDVDTAAVVRSDALHDTIDYRDAYAIAEDLVVRQQFHLVETLADRIAARCLATLRVVGVRVRLRKLLPPLSGMINYVEVRSSRSRAGDAP